MRSSLPLVFVFAAMPWTATAAISVVSSFGDSGAPGQLRTLITAAAPGDTIVIPPGTIVLTGAPGENANVSGDLDVNKALTIVGSGSALTVIDAAGVDRAIDVLAAGHLVLSGVTLRNGRVDTDSYGGGIQNVGTLKLVVSVVENSFSGGGGGVYNSGNASVESSTVRNNFTKGVFGGGGGVVSFGTMTMADSTVSGNTTLGPSASGNGGGIENIGKMELTNVTVSGNKAFVHGGGIFQGASATALTLRNVTITQNITHHWGGGIEIMGAAPKPVNTIVAGNASETSVTGKDCSGNLSSLGNNLIQDPSDCTITGIVAGNILGVAALLDPLGDNGGPTQTHALQASSPALDAGSTPGAPGYDQRGVLRPRDGNGDGSAISDMGAFER